MRKEVALNSDFMQSLAQSLGETKEYYGWARRPLMEYWRQSDDAYLCYRQLPQNAGMQWTDKSDFGSTDIFDGVNMLATKLSLALMPKDGSWLTVVSRENDDAKVVQAIQAQQLWMHDRAKTRQMVARHLKQLMVRGTSALHITWEHRTRRKQISSPLGRKRLKALMKAGKAEQANIDLIDQYYEEVPAYIGPKIRVVDALDLFLDPAHDLTVDRNSSYIVSTYRRLAELLKETNADDELLYSNLKDINGWTPSDIYMKDVEGSNRVRNLNTMGVFPQNQTNDTEVYIPVYVCYFPYYSHQGEDFYDTYFHLAEDKQGMKRLIRIEQNPSIDGHQFVIKDTMVDWFGNTAYGISLVEKLISKYNQKQVLEAVTLEAAITSVFPAYNVLSGVLRDDTGVSFSPGNINEVAQNPAGLNVMAPVPAPLQGVGIGMQEIRFWGEDIKSGFGEWGAAQNNPTRSVQTRETATAANINASSGSLATDELVEKYSVSIQEMAQLCFNLSQQELKPDPKTKKLSYPQYAGPGAAKQAEIDWDDFVVPRDIMVSGRNGAFDKAAAVNNRIEFLKAIAQAAPMMPSAAQVVQPIIFEIAEKLDISIPDDAKTPPDQLAASNPEVVQAVMHKLAQEHPQIAAVVQQMMQAEQAQGGKKPAQQGNPMGMGQ
jgi:hypothetical protein